MYALQQHPGPSAWRQSSVPFIRHVADMVDENAIWLQLHVTPVSARISRLISPYVIRNNYTTFGVSGIFGGTHNAMFACL